MSTDGLEAFLSRMLETYEKVANNIVNELPEALVGA
jgi:hypothetical protein